MLWLAGWVFAAGSAIHVADHLRRGSDSISETLSRLGNVALVIQVVTVTLVLTRHHLAPMFATVAGFALAAGFAAAHWLPEWSSLSDPVWEIDSLGGLSLFASGLEIAGALAIGIAGARCLADPSTA
jgi:hypothetical protein